MVQPGLYDCLAKRLEARHVEGDIVIDEEDCPGAVGSGVAYVGEHPVEGKSMELATAHRDDRAKTAIESTTTRGLDDVDLAAKHGITSQNPGLAVGQPDLTAVKSAHRTIRVMAEVLRHSVLLSPKCVLIPNRFDCPQQVP